MAHALVRIGGAQLLKGQLFDAQEGRVVGGLWLDVLDQLHHNAPKDEVAAKLWPRMSGLGRGIRICGRCVTNP